MAVSSEEALKQPDTDAALGISGQRAALLGFGIQTNAHLLGDSEFLCFPTHFPISRVPSKKIQGGKIRFFSLKKSCLKLPNFSPVLC